MKANDFVKAKGIKAAKLIVDCWSDYPETDVYLPDTMEYTFIALAPTKTCPYVSLIDLQSLVESHDLVESKGGLAKCKEINERDNFTWCSGSRVYANPLEKAIADFESCGGSHEFN